MAILTLFREVLKRRGSASLRVSVNTLLRFLPLALSLASGGALAQPCCAPPQTPAEALFRSIENGDSAEFTRLLDAGVGLAEKNKLGETLLYVAAEKGEIDMARTLIARGADAKARTPNGETVLHAASMIESAALTTALIQAGAEVGAANTDGETPLQWAALTGTFLAVKALADAGADLNVQDARLGNTPLHAAVSHDDIVLIHYLLSRNVRTDLRNNQGLTALELAQSRGRASAKLFEDAQRP
jgi:ankyrin repeat protein